MLNCFAKKLCNYVCCGLIASKWLSTWRKWRWIVVLYDIELLCIKTHKRFIIERFLSDRTKQCTEYRQVLPFSYNKQSERWSFYMKTIRGKKKRESTGELILPFSVSSVSPFNSALKLCNAVYATTFIRKQILRQRCADVWRDPSFPNVSTFLVLDLTCTLCLWNILATKQISPKRTALSVGRNVRYPHALYPTSQKFLRFCSWQTFNAGLIDNGPIPSFRSNFS